MQFEDLYIIIIDKKLSEDDSLVNVTIRGYLQTTLTRLGFFLTTYPSSLTTRISFLKLIRTYHTLEIKPCGFESRIRDVCS